jgi:hypothetical protein
MKRIWRATANGRAFDPPALLGIRRMIAGNEPILIDLLGAKEVSLLSGNPVKPSHAKPTTG